MGENIEVEGTRDVAGLLLVPLKSANTNLESVHSGAVVLQFLISIFNLIETMSYVFLINAEA